MAFSKSYDNKKLEEVQGIITNIVLVEKLTPEDLKEIFEIGLESFKVKRRIRDNLPGKKVHPDNITDNQ